MSVSAIISAYYCEQYLDARIRNLQINTDAEIIVVCQDGSAELEITRQYPDVIRITTAGVPTIYGAWNMAILASNCDYITNANADDETYPGSYDDMEKALCAQPDTALVYGDNHVRISGEPTISLLSNYHERMEGGLDVLRRFCFVGPFPMWRKSLHAKYGYFNDRYQVCGDYEYWLRIMSAGEKFHHLRYPVGCYLKRPDSAEHRNPEIAKQENIQVRKMYGGL